MEPKPFEIGLYTFVENTPDPYTGQLQDPAQRMRDLLEQAHLADQVGLDVFAVGEHHREEYLASAPAVVLAAIAERTQRIRLSSAVTVLSSDDPVRVFQQFATLDLLSRGRAEIMAGRGSFIESFPLFGYDLDDYSALFEEKLELLLKIRAQERVTWSGRFRPALHDQPVYPRPVQNPLPVWVAVGGTPQSVVRAARLGLPMALAIIGGMPERFAPLFELYRQTAQRLGHAPQPLSINSHGFIADDPREALELAYTSSSYIMNRIGQERGWPPPEPRPVRSLHRPARGQLCRPPRTDHRENPVPAQNFRSPTLLAPAHRGHPPAPQGSAGHRAARHRGSAGGAEGDRSTNEPVGHLLLNSGITRRINWSNSGTVKAISPCAGL